ncbi:hypothetical protein [Croceimicrobium sp.]|uniref:hypothetical protein n=1 Tax=Croceimicrobium sp. TaxID=2828340 RepID=UPI003BACC30B
MRKLSLILLTCLSISAFAQDEPEYKREFGLIASGLNNFGAIYKQPTDKGNYWRFHLANLQYQYQDNSTSNFNSSAGAILIGIGYEFRKGINEDFQFIHGPQPNLSLNFSNSSSAMGVGLAYVLGAQYKLNTNFYIGLEIKPGLNYRVSDLGGTEQSNLFLNASNDASLFIVYRF